MGLWPLELEGKSKSCRLNSPGYTQGKVDSKIKLQAEALRSKLDPDYPSFIKCLVKSHVTGGFWMGLPILFCQNHLPQEDTFMTLKTQNGKLYKAKYLARKTGLSGGWKRFATAERLLVGDVLVFHLVSSTKFKVYIVREKDLNEVDGALNLLNLDTHAEPVDPDVRTIEQDKKTHPASSLPAIARYQDEEMHCTEVINSRFTNGSRPPEAVVSSSCFTSFEKFNMLIDELLNDYVLPRHIKWSYYKLCCSQNALLHAHLPNETNHVLIAGIIIETVRIVDALTNCELSTFQSEYSVWDKFFDSFERFGMNVGFLRARLHSLHRLSCDPEIVTCRQEYSQLCSKNAQVGDVIRSLEARLFKLKEVYNQHAAKIKNLQEKIKNHELKFHQEISAPW